MNSMHGHLGWNGTVNLPGHMNGSKPETEKNYTI